MNPYMFEISNYIENSVTQADLILQSLYDNHLKTRQSTNTHAGQKTFSFKKRKAADVMLFQPKRPKIEEIKHTGTVLDEIISLYYAAWVTLDEKQCIIDILSAYSSYFPKEAFKLPEDIRSKLKPLTPSDVMASMIDEKMIHTMINSRIPNGLDPFLSELPDKGKNILQTILKSFLNLTPIVKIHDPGGNALGHFSNTIDTMPLKLQKDIVTALVESLENEDENRYSYSNTLLNSLTALSHVVSKFPEWRERARKKSNKILRSHLGCSDVARCLNALAKTSKKQSYDDRKTISRYLMSRSITSGYTIKYSELDSLSELSYILSISSKTMITKVIIKICSIASASNNISINILALKILGNLSHRINTLPDHIINTVIRTMIEAIPTISNSGMYHCQEKDVLAISKLRYIFQNRLLAFEKIASAIFDNALTNSFYNDLMIKLFCSWKDLIKYMPDQGTLLFDKLYQHYVNNEHHKWLDEDIFASIVSSFEHLSIGSRKLIDFFVSQLQHSDKNTRIYAIQALGSLHFSLAALPDSGLSILIEMKKTLDNIQNDNDLHIEILVAFNKMSNVMAIHPEFIQPIIMKALDITSDLGLYLDEFLNVMSQLYRNFKYALTFEDRKFIYQKLENVDKNAALHDGFWTIICDAPNNKAMLNAKLTMYNELLNPPMAKVVLHLQNQHLQLLSWLCVIKNTMPKNRIINMIEDLSPLFLKMKRAELLSKKLPMELVNHVETFVSDKTFKMA